VAARRPRVVTTRALNRALLARQGLLERHPPGIARALERAGGIQAQYAPSMYTGVWSRMEGLERAALTRALERGTVVQATLMRSTIHLVSARDFWPFADGVRRSRREWWRRVTTDRPSDTAMRAAAERLREAFASADGGVLRRAEIEALLGKPVARAIGMWIDLVRAPPSGTWERRRADLYALADAWVDPPAGSMEERERAGAEHLVRRYVAAFGPAAPGDVAGWAGIPVAALEEAFASPRLRRFVTGDGAELMDVPRAPLPPADTVVPVRFLPTWDATLLVHARRTQILPEDYRPRIFHTKNPQSVPTFLVDGAVAGVWRFEGGRVELEPFRSSGPGVMRALREEAERLASFLA
jgi:winged helix DNA-binding protein